MPLCSLSTQLKPVGIIHDITDKGCSWLDAESFGFVRLHCMNHAMYSNGTKLDECCSQRVVASLPSQILGQEVCPAS